MWVSASRRAVRHTRREDEIKTCREIIKEASLHCGFVHVSVCRERLLTFRWGRDGALARLVELGGEGEPETAHAQDGQHDTHTQPCSHLTRRHGGGKQRKLDEKEYGMPSSLSSSAASTLRETTSETICRATTLPRVTIGAAKRMTFPPSSRGGNAPQIDGS